MRLVVYISFVIILMQSISAKEDPKEYQIRTNNIYVEDFKKSSKDFLTDLVIAGIREYLIEHNDTEVRLPTINVEQTGVVFTAYDGTFKNPATISRQGDTKMKFKNYTADISVDVGFSTVELYFKKYQVKLIGFIEDSGTIDIKVGKNSVQIMLEVNLFPCIVTIKSVSMSELKDISVDLTGLSVFDSLADSIVEWILQSYQTSFTELIEEIIEQKLKEALSNIKIVHCKYKKVSLNKKEI